MNVRALTIPILGSILGLAAGCAPAAMTTDHTPAPRAQEADTAATSVQFGVAGGLGSGSGLDAAADSLAARDYTDQTLTGETTAMVRAWARREMVPGIFGKLTYEYRFGTDLETEDPTAANPRIADLRTKEYTLSLTGEVPVGPVWLEAGPALKILKLAFTEEITVGSQIFGDHRVETLTQVGAVVRTSFRYPVIPEMNLLGSAGYSYFPDAEASETLAAPVGVGGWSVVVGLEWAPGSR